MSHIPSFEEILTEVHQRLGYKAQSNKKRFIGYEMEVEGHSARVQQLLFQIFDAFELDNHARQCVTVCIATMSEILKAIELNTWTGNASQRQVLWHLLACLYVPLWAKILADWSLANVDHGLPPADAGMPGGEFWYLPTTVSETGEIRLPIPKVLGWLLDLLDQSSVEKLRDVVGNKHLRETEGGNEASVRTLRKWLEGGLPKSDNKIAEVFPDDATLIFEGALQLNAELSPEMRFEKTLEFVVQQKKLNAIQLSDQIPMKSERLVPVFERTASEEEKAAFVLHVSIRYGAPTMAIIRQRLRVARLAQSGYLDLVKFLCPELKPEDKHDPTHNKVLQLIVLFEMIYNRTIESWHHGNSTAEQDAWFEQQCAPLDINDFMLPILSSIDWNKKVSIIAERLTRRLLSTEPEQGLEDILPIRESDSETVLRSRLERWQREHEEEKRVHLLRQRIKAASPYRALQAESNFWVLSHFALADDLSEKVHQMALIRMTAVAATPLERGYIRFHELKMLLNRGARKWQPDVQDNVRRLLDVAEADELAWESWKAPMLNLKAKHAVFENRLDDAEKLFKEALAACSERAFGSVRGEIAQNGFAVALIRSALNRKNHEPYYRNMLYFKEFPEGTPSFEDTAAECEEFFWADLYRPYPGFDSHEGTARKNSKAFIKETVELIKTGDLDGFIAWLRRNEKTFHHSDFKDARRSSALMLSLKLLYEFEDRLPMMMRPEDRGQLTKLELHRKSIGLLLDAWPDQARISDFKGQTAAMLAANHGDTKLLALLAPLSNIDAQDYLGRTLLHATVAGRSLACLEIVLKLNPDISKVSQEEANTAAHTAVRFGWGDGLYVLLDQFPELIGIKNHQGQTPVSMARELLEHYDAWRDFMQKSMGRSVGTRSDFEAMCTLLERFQPLDKRQPNTST